MLGMLAAVERDSHVTQRHLARELGIALGPRQRLSEALRQEGLHQDPPGAAQPLRLLPDAARLRRKEPPHRRIPHRVVRLLPPRPARRGVAARFVPRARLEPRGAVGRGRARRGDGAERGRGGGFDPRRRRCRGNTGGVRRPARRRRSRRGGAARGRDRRHRHHRCAEPARKPRCGARRLHRGTASRPSASSRRRCCSSRRAAKPAA